MKQYTFNLQMLPEEMMQIMTISERIFNRLDELSMSQKEFSEKTGILQSTISEWKKKGTNPTSEKIMIICKILNVSPEWLLSGADGNGRRGNQVDWFVVGRDSDLGRLIVEYNGMDAKGRARLFGYLEAMKELG